MALDRQRLLRIEELAHEVLTTQEALVELDRQKNGRREALGAFRRKEANVGSTHWVATSGQFLRLPGKVARPWLTQQQEDTDAKIAEGRARLKALLQALVSEHPQVTDLPLGVCDLLLEQRRTQEKVSKADTSASAASVARNVLDYSRFNHIGASDSEDES